MTTTEKNGIIAEFMGFSQGRENETRWKNDWFDDEGVINGQRNTRLLFDTSWDWLMPVVEKIEDIRVEPDTDIVSYHRFSVNMPIYQCTIIDTVTDKVVGEGDNATKLLSTFDAIVEFILWYNKNKEQ